MSASENRTAFVQVHSNVADERLDRGPARPLGPLRDRDFVATSTWLIRSSVRVARRIIAIPPSRRPRPRVARETVSRALHTIARSCRQAPQTAHGDGPARRPARASAAPRLAGVDGRRPMIADVDASLVAAGGRPRVAFLAGVVSFASPCVLPARAGLPLVRDRRDGRRTASPSAGAGWLPILLFIGGFTLVFTLSARSPRRSSRSSRDRPGQIVAGVVVVLLGAADDRLRAAARADRALRRAASVPREGAAGRGRRVPARDGVRGRVDAVHRPGPRRRSRDGRAAERRRGARSC